MRHLRLVAFLGAITLLSAPAPAGDLPTVDEIFANLQQKSRALNGLRCTFWAQTEYSSDAQVRGRFEFRAPGLLRNEHLQALSGNWVMMMFGSIISAVAPDGRWTYVALRDEAATGADHDFRGFGWAFVPWEGPERTYAAILAPEVFYKEYDIRRVFPDVLGGKRCYLVLLAKKGWYVSDRLWIDPERWTLLRLEFGRTPASDVPWVYEASKHEQVKPGVWLPTEFHCLKPVSEAVYVRDVEADYVPAQEHFELPRHDPLLIRRGATACISGDWYPPAEELDPHDPAYGYAAPFVAQATGLLGRDMEEAAKNLEDFVAKNPHIRAGYHELAACYDELKRHAQAVELLQRALKTWPEDACLAARLIRLIQRAPEPLGGLEFAEFQRLCDMLPRPWNLEELISAQVKLAKHDDARRTAGELLKAWAGREDLSRLPVWGVVNAAQKGGWLEELRRECQERIAAKPPSELHLRLLKAIESSQSKTREEETFLLRLAEMRRDSPCVQLECARMLAYRGPGSSGSAAQIYMRLLDALPEEECVARSAAIRGLSEIGHWMIPIEEGWNPEREAATVQAIVKPLREALEKETGQTKDKLTKAQLLWRYRVLAAWYSDAKNQVKYLRLAVAISPEDDELNPKLAEALHWAGEDDEVARLCEGLASLHPGRPEVWIGCLGSMTDRTKPERLREVVDRLIGCAPTEARTYDKAADAYANLGLPEEAARMKTMQAEFDLPIRRMDLMHEAAHLLTQGQDLDRAVEAWMELVRALPQPRTEGAREQARLYSEIMSFQAEATREEKPKDWVTNAWIPALERAMERYDRQGSAVQRAALRIAMAGAFERLSDHLKAADFIQRGLEIWPEFPRGRSWLASTLTRSDETDIAVEAWLSALRDALESKLPQKERAREVEGCISAFSRQAWWTQKGTEWVQKSWLPALEKASGRYEQRGGAEERAALQFAICGAHEFLGENVKAFEFAQRGLELMPGYDELKARVEELRAKLPPDPAAELKKLLASRKVIWQRDDPHDANLLWIAFEDRLVGFDKATSKKLTFEFGMGSYRTSGLALTADRVFAGTDKGMVVFDRKGGFWSRLAVGAEYVDIPVTEILLKDDARFEVTAQAEGQGPQRFEYDLKTSKWRKLR